MLTVFLSSNGPALESAKQVDPSDIVQNELRTLSNDNLTHNQNLSLSSVIKFQQQKLKGFGLVPNPQVRKYHQKCWDFYIFVVFFQQKKQKIKYLMVHFPPTIPPPFEHKSAPLST